MATSEHKILLGSPIDALYTGPSNPGGAKFLNLGGLILPGGEWVRVKLTKRLADTHEDSPDMVRLRPVECSPEPVAPAESMISPPEGQEPRRRSSVRKPKQAPKKRGRPRKAKG